MEKIKSILGKTTIQSILALIIIVGGMLFLSFIKSTDSISTSIFNLMMLCAGFYFGASKNNN